MGCGSSYGVILALPLTDWEKSQNICQCQSCAAVQLLLPLLRDMASCQWVNDSRPFSQKLQCRRGTLGLSSCDISNLETSWTNSPVTQSHSQNGRDLKLSVRIKGISVIFEHISCRIRCEKGKSFIFSMFLALIRHIKCIKDQKIRFTLLMYFYCIMVNTLMSIRNMLVTQSQLKTVYEYKIKAHFFGL